MRMFPIQSQRGAAPHPLSIPWGVAELAYSVYSAMYGRGQSLERLAERGGFGPNEMDDFLPDWRERCSDIMRLSVVNRRLVAACKALLERSGRWKDDPVIVDAHDAIAYAEAS